MPRKEKVQLEIEVSSKKLHVEHASCPRGHLLRDESVKINGYPSIKVRVRKGDQEGLLFLDPVYGSYKNVERDIDLRTGDVVRMYCPECGTDLTNTDETCRLCSSPMFVFQLPHGGIVEGCLKKGCMFHKMKIVDNEAQIDRLFENKTLESYL